VVDATGFDLVIPDAVDTLPEPSEEAIEIVRVFQGEL